MTHKTAVPMLLIVGWAALPIFARVQAQTTNAAPPHFHGQAPGQAQQRLRQVKGVIQAVDTKGMTLTLESAGQCRTFKVTSKTRFVRPNGAPGSFGEVAVGRKAELILQYVLGQPEQLVTVHLKAD